MSKSGSLKNWFFSFLAATLLSCQHAQTPESKSVAENAAGVRDPAAYGKAFQWNEYSGVRTTDQMAEKFSPIDQINVSNVKRIRKIWIYNTGDGAKPGPKSLELTPVYHQGKLYGCSTFNRIFALDAETGRELWSHDPNIKTSDKIWTYKCRGVAIWTNSGLPEQTCNTRVISNTMDGRLIALDAETGDLCSSFVERSKGKPILGAPVGEVAPWVNVMTPYRGKDRIALITGQKDHPFRDEYFLSSAPLIYKDLIIVGGGITDNVRAQATSGAVQAFDVRTGELKWLWDMAPPGLKTAKQLVTPGTPNAWAPMTADEGRGLIFIPTGGASPDYFAAQRNGKDQFATSVVALRVEEKNGVVLRQPRLEWQFKTVIQDKWDYDVPTAPVLTHLNVNDRPVPVVIQGTKTGFIFILNRDTGKPIFPTPNGFLTPSYKDLLQEVSTAGVVPEEKIISRKSDFVTETRSGKSIYKLRGNGSHSSLQPFPPKEWQLHDTPLTKKELMDNTASAACKELTSKYNYDGPFTPPSLVGGINFPGAIGGIDWGGVTIDPINQILFVNQIRVATISQLLPRAEYKRQLEAAGGASLPQAYKEAYSDMEGTPYGLHRFPFIDHQTNLPCSAMPYGTLKAVSLKDGRLKWTKVFGNLGELAPAAKALNEVAGVPNFGGSLVTRGGVLFIAATADSLFRMYNSDTGELIHQLKLDEFEGGGSGAAIPMTYLSPAGRQIVVVASGGNHYIPGKTGDAVIAFALDGAQ